MTKKEAKSEKDFAHLLELCREYGKIWKENGGPEAVKERLERERKSQFVWAS